MVVIIIGRGGGGGGTRYSRIRYTVLCISKSKYHVTINFYPLRLFLEQSRTFPLKHGISLTLLHSERPKLFQVLTILSAVGLIVLSAIRLMLHITWKV